MPRLKFDRHDRLVRLAVAYDDASQENTLSIEVPEDLTALEDADLEKLRQDAVEAFDALYDDENPSAESVESMTKLAEVAESVRGEEQRRDEQRAANREAAEALASRARGEQAGEGGGDEGGEEGAEAGDGGEGAEGAEAADEQQPEAVTAGATINVSLPGVRKRQSAQEPVEETPAGVSLIASSDLGGKHSAGDEIGVADAAKALARKAQGINESAYRAAAASGRRLTQSLSVATVSKNIPQELTASADNAMEVIDRAADESRLEGGSLVAAGGWCSPSETLYDLCSLEEAAGLISLPEIGVERGGIRFTNGPNFTDLYSDTGFTFTEEQDEGGQYDDGEVGDKPCFKVACEDFEEERLRVSGVCITAGILQNRAYPELTERTIAGALIAHQHRVAGNIIGQLGEGSTAVTMPSDQVGAAAPILTSVELQATHYRYVNRMSPDATLEVVMPEWGRGVIRTDLSRRLGVPLENVTNARITEHFNTRNVSVQWVYNYQDLTGDGANFTAWPETLSFLIYAAGTWVRGSSDLITLESVFDSALIAQNDFTALFTEEGWLVAKRCHDSREVTVPLCPSGHTAGGVLLDCDGSQGEAA